MNNSVNGIYQKAMHVYINWRCIYNLCNNLKWDEWFAYEFFMTWNISYLDLFSEKDREKFPCMVIFLNQYMDDMLIIKKCYPVL